MARPARLTAQALALAVVVGLLVLLVWRVVHNDNNGISQALTEARNKGVNVVDFRDFFPRMGYKVRTDITEDKINQAAARYLSTIVPMSPDSPNPNE